MKAFRLNKCENYGIKNCMSSTLKDISCQKKTTLVNLLSFNCFLFLPNFSCLFDPALDFGKYQGPVVSKAFSLNGG